MEFNKQTVKALLGVVCGGIAFAAALLHLDVVAGAAGWLLGILSPLLLGCAIAFILNVPMRALERCLFPHAKKANKLRRPLALLLTVAAVSAVLALAGMVIVPGVRDAVTSIAAQVPEAFERLQESAARFQEYLPLLANQIEGLSIDWASLSQKAVGLVQNWGKGLLISGGGAGQRHRQRRHNLFHRPDLFSVHPAAKGKTGPAGPSALLRLSAGGRRGSASEYSAAQ